MATTDADARPFSDELEEWLRSDRPKTLGAMNDVFGEKSFAVTVMLLMFLPATPLPTGGVTHVFEAATVLLALQLLAGRREVWLPARLRDRELGAVTTGKAVPFIIRRVRWFERHSHRRGSAFVSSRVALRVVALLIIGFTVASALAPPFSGLDTLPALAVVCLALGIILEDVLVAVVGVAIGSVGVVLIITIGAAIARFLRNLI